MAGCGAPFSCLMIEMCGGTIVDDVGVSGTAVVGVDYVVDVGSST